MATIDDFKKIELRVGRIEDAQKVEGSEKLVKLHVSFGDAGQRQIVAGIAPHYPDTSVLVGRRCAFAFNLEPRVLMGLESQGMVLAVGETGAFSLLFVEGDVAPGSIVR